MFVKMGYFIESVHDLPNCLFSSFKNCEYYFQTISSTTSMFLHLLLVCFLGQCLAGADEAVTATNLDENNFKDLVRNLKLIC